MRGKGEKNIQFFSHFKELTYLCSPNVRPLHIVVTKQAIITIKNIQK
jgi:hypothetical protein